MEPTAKKVGFTQDLKDKYLMKKEKDDQPVMPDENMQVFTFGNLKIIDLQTKQVLVNKSF